MEHCQKEYYENGTIRQETYTTDEGVTRREHVIGYDRNGNVAFHEIYIDGEFRQLY